MNEKGNFLRKFHYHLECLMSPKTAVYYLKNSVVGIVISSHKKREVIEKDCKFFLLTKNLKSLLSPKNFFLYSEKESNFFQGKVYCIIFFVALFQPYERVVIQKMLSACDKK